MSELGINLSFAVKRWPEPDAWCRIVREVLGLRRVQLTFDLLDPWWPEDLRQSRVNQVRRAAAGWDIEIHSAFVGLAAYTYNGLLDPDPAVRAGFLTWWRRAIDIAAAVGARAIGGPLGGMSVTDVADAGRRERLVAEAIEAVRTLSDAAGVAGLVEFLIEPTPLEREIPSTLDQARWLLTQLAGQTAVPVRYVLDVGHILFQPRYGPAARADDWFAALGDQIGALHLQNTDFQSDSHWGWPDDRGQFDVADVARRLATAHLSDVPIFLEVFYPFELADAAVLANVTSSVDHCRQALRVIDPSTTRR